MANKPISLKTNIYFNAFLFSLFFILVLLFSYFFINQYQKIDERKQLTESFEKQINRIYDIKNNIFAGYQSVSGITPQQANEFNEYIKNAEIIFYKSFIELTDKKFIKKNQEIQIVCDSLKTSFQSQAKNASLLVSALLQRGTKNSGNVEEILKSSKKLESIAGESDLRNARLISQELVLLGQQQAYEKDPLYKNIILQKAMQAKEEFDKADGNNNTGYLGEIENILSSSAAIHNLDALIGFRSNSGLLGKIKGDYKRTTVLLNNLQNFVNQSSKNFRIKLSIYFILSLIFFLAFIIYYYLMGSITFVVKPLELFFNSLEELVKGKLLEKDLNIKSNNSLKVFGDDINLLNANLRNKTEFAKRLNKGDTNCTLELLSDEDVLGNELIALQKNLQMTAEERRAHDEENEKRRYINEGLAKFSEITHSGYDKIEKLTDVFIRELVKYLKCLQGGVFLMNDEEENNFLNLSSAFAYNRKKYITRKIPLGEGLVGTCALEKKTIKLSEIPENYMMITSGLGDTPPRYLILVPMIIDEKVLGVIEVASLSEFKDFELDFLEQVSVSLGSIITNTKINERTAALLDQSRLHTQEMAEQEEEMRQNMEELKATQEESVRREEEFRGIVDAIAQTFFQMEFDVNGRLININEKLLIFLGKTINDLLGKSYPEIISGRNSDELTNEVIEDIFNGKKLTLKDTLRINKKDYSIQFNFTSILNKDSLPVKIMCLGIEIKDK